MSLKRRASTLCRCGLLFLAAASLLGSFAGGRQIPVDLPQPKTIVIGFVGGVLKHNDRRRNEVLLAETLHADFPTSAVVRVFENTRSAQAHRLILEQLELQPKGGLSPADKQRARIVLYGHSWGASEAVALARKLQKEGIPVLLTIQVDSVQKLGENDAVIPSNVREAVNFYQQHGLIHGRARIHAQNPVKTNILGNFLVDYQSHPVKCADYPWYERTFAKTHSEIECDPSVWSQVDALIRSKILPTASTAPP